ncbi:dipeptide transport ATP-binding protein DppF [Gracilibacillus boraciitolerans JCM 21714]|uniref:Dipeptide transport ATP-binding protein DppF n=1 Tax=Gracilibacillus boraciitolerans JCM 21714 TaxID=1298598 RepID=W4VFB1_9BACI|nr:ATP-binding cassette domain-containing protein [Gracilibacillus boraciitolerans]GAE91897.1 dipeptide transport ATP-binding protein DppF [Gracilibacillus boraciitolerans JCM 21714]
MLKIDNISYSLPNGQALFKNMSMIIEYGEIIGISGASGIGKTTFSKVVAGYISQETGDINWKQKKHKAHPIQLIWQHPELAVNPKWRIQKILEEAGSLDASLLIDLNISLEWLNRYPYQLSGGGELQRVCIARCLLAKPKFIIADEITSMLDAISQAEIWKVLLDYVKKNNVGLVIISHDKILLDKLCNKILDFSELMKPIKQKNRIN